MRRQLQELMEFQSNMMAALTYDLRSRIHSLENRIRQEWLDPQAQERSLEILRQIRVLTDDTLYLLTGQGAQEAFERDELRSLVEAVLDDINEKYQEVRFDGGPRRLVVKARGNALFRAIENLVRNARLHGGNAEVSLAQSGNKAIVEISDRGPGVPTRLPDGTKVDVTKPFVCGDPSRSIRTSGSGLVLSIAQGIIEDHGGRLDLLPREGGGTVARVTLHLCQERR